MTKYLRIFALIFCAVLTTAATDLTVAENGKSTYRIVVLKGDNEKINRFNLIAAEELHKSIKEATGASLSVSYQAQPDTPSIFIGYGAEVEQAGIDSSTFKKWTYVINSDAKNIYLTGYDKSRYPLETSKYYNQYYLGSVKAVLEFSKKFCGTSYVLPGENGKFVAKMDKITVPANFNFTQTPQIQYCFGRSKGMTYDLANNFYSAISYGCYGGHSHDKAVPADKYFQEHPEYFALLNGKRTAHATKPQHCFSNPQVRELIYQELLEHTDKGYDWVQLAQSDGFLACECDNCRNLYGIQSTLTGKEARKDPTWGEKIWIMHIDMAKRFAKDRPGKKLVILAYGPTKAPPKSIKKFPENVIVELCNNSPEDFAQWNQTDVPGGFVTYIYNWGYYHAEGFTPKRTPQFCQEQLKLFTQNNVRGIYRCGGGEELGLEGPVYYIYGQLLTNPNADINDIADKYYKNAFGKAYSQMKSFFDLLHERVALKLDDETTDWNDSDLLAGAKNLKQKNMKLLVLRYPQSIISQLENSLNSAENIAENSKVKLRLKLVRTEFDYLKVTASLCELFISYTQTPSFELLKQLSNSITARNDFIKALPKYSNGKIENQDGFTLFGTVPEKTLNEGGRLSGLLTGPFKWNFDYYIKHQIVPGARQIKAPFCNETITVDGKPDEMIWKQGAAQQLIRLYMDKNKTIIDSKIKVTYDNDAYYVLAEYQQVNPDDLKNDWLYVFIGSQKDKSNSYMFTCRLQNTTPSCYKCSPGTGQDNTDEYNYVSSSGNMATAKNEDTNTYFIEIRIPFSALGAKPANGDIWYGNFMRRKEMENLIWEPNIFHFSWRDRYQAMGKIIFE